MICHTHLYSRHNSVVRSPKLSPAPAVVLRTRGAHNPPLSRPTRLCCKRFATFRCAGQHGAYVHRGDWLRGWQPPVRPILERTHHLQHAPRIRGERCTLVMCEHDVRRESCIELLEYIRSIHSAALMARAAHAELSSRRDKHHLRVSN